jgi:hypothetical protein
VYPPEEMFGLRWCLLESAALVLVVLVVVGEILEFEGSASDRVDVRGYDTGSWMGNHYLLRRDIFVP